MTIGKLLALAGQDDELIIKWSQLWAETVNHSAVDEKNPVINAQKWRRYLFKSFGFVTLLALMFVLGSLTVRRTGDETALQITIAVVEGLVSLGFFAGTIWYLLMAFNYRSEASRFCEAISLIESACGKFKDTPEWKSLEAGNEKWMLCVGNRLLMPKAREVKRMQSVPWKKKAAAKEREEFSHMHWQLQQLQFAEPDRRCYFE